MASAILKRDNLIRLMYCLAKSCTEVTKALVLHYLPLAKPIDIEEQKWNMDEFLDKHRDGFFLRKFVTDEYKKRILFPGRSKDTNINHWDLAILFTVLRLFKDLDRAIKADMTHMRKLRNTLFHWGTDEMTATNFDINQRKIEHFVDNCCRVIGNDSIKNEIKVILEDMEETERIEEALHTELEIWKKDDILDKLDKSETVIVSALEEVHMKVTDIFGIAVQQMPDINLALYVKNCSKETSSMATEILYQHMRNTPPVSESATQLRDAIDEAVQKLLCGNRLIREICKACLILTVQCPDFNSLKSLLEECLSGKLTAIWKSVEICFRHLYNNDKLTLEFTITNSDFWCCIEELVEKLTTAVHKQVGVDISPHLSPTMMVHPSTTQSDGKGSETEVSVVPITIQPNSYRHAIQVSDIIQSGSLTEDFRKISNVLADIYGMNDVTIAANLRPTETYSEQKEVEEPERRRINEARNRNKDRKQAQLQQQQQKHTKENTKQKSSASQQSKKEIDESFLRWNPKAELQFAREQALEAFGRDSTIFAGESAHVEVEESIAQENQQGFDLSSFLDDN